MNGITTSSFCSLSFAALAFDAFRAAISVLSLENGSFSFAALAFAGFRAAMSFVSQSPPAASVGPFHRAQPREQLQVQLAVDIA